ncbi:MAG: isoleucine--tRNA ligase [Candidatus Aenigmatarchaeota archaeon]
MNYKLEEDKIQEFWVKNNIRKKALVKNKGKKKFYFLDGPPYATGYIHLGTAWNKVLKDSFLRYKRMKGFDVWSQPGYDTHGLPIENKVEKKLGFKSKQDIEKMGVEKFNQECRKFATEFIDIMNKQFENLGVWMDWENPYLTLTKEYIEGAWHTFKVGYEKGLLYKDRYAVHVCPHCETAVAYNEIEYSNVSDPSIYVKFPVKGQQKTYLLIWTTTPWTLPSNTGIMAKPSAEYAYVSVGDETIILAKDLVETVMKKGKVKDYKIRKIVKGSDLEGLEYTHPLSEIFPFHRNIKNAWRVVLSDQYVTLEEGTGLVHTAPGHGEEDYKVGKENGLPIVSPLNMNGRYNDECGEYSGKFVKDADQEIIDEFNKKGLLFASETIKHDYPFCWRCSSPLIFMAVPQWFFKVTKIRDKLLEENKKVNWIPDWAGKRFHNWIESLGDWPITRQRYWGIPLPIWECQCGNTKVIGSSKELPKDIEDLHKPYVDEITFKCEKCGSEMKRIPDVLDVWFDSGVAPWASLGYPGRDDLFKRLWPNDFNLEGPDQIRGWWNSQMITSVITFGRRPFENILFHGFVLDVHGNKMSKSKGNIIAPEDVIEKYGRDVFRYYFLSNPPWEDFYFSWDGVEDVSKKLNIIRNTFQFVKTYVTDHPKKKPKLIKEDEWILSRLNQTILEYDKNFEKYLNYKSIEILEKFLLEDYSRFYIKLIRDRVSPGYDGEDKKSAFYTLIKVTESVVKLLAPVCPFMSEIAYQDLKKIIGKKESVHLEEFPAADETIINKDLENKMSIANEIIESTLALRQKAGLKLRWAAKRLVLVSVKDEVKETLEELGGVISRMTNVLELKITKTHPKGNFVQSTFTYGEIFLDITEDEDLVYERLYREIVRKIQSMRKKAGLVVSDRIALTLKSDKKTEYLLKKMVVKLSAEVGASDVKIGEIKGNFSEKLEFGKSKIDISFS